MASTHCMMGGPALACLVPWAPGPNLAEHANRAINGLSIVQQDHHLLSVIQAATNTEHL